MKDDQFFLNFFSFFAFGLLTTLGIRAADHDQDLPVCE